MTKLALGLDRFIEICLIVLMFLIVMTVSWQVLSRYLLHAPSSISEELARFLLIWISMVGAVYCYRTKAHLGLNLLTNKMKPSQQKVALLFSHLVILIFALLVLIVGGIELIMFSSDPLQLSPVLSIPMASIYLVLPLTGVLFCFYAVMAFVDVKQMSAEQLSIEQGDLK